MNKTKHKSRIKVESSTRDSISTWLDVLTAMLVMPESQRAQVRDELEDHLRSRVDDLLIVGKPESEAIQIAVTELGETAELAKLITHAHTQINPRRKLMNAALITVALAGMSFGGFSFINGTGAPSATPSNGGAVPVVVSDETRKAEEKVHQFNIEEASVLDVFQEILRAFGQGYEFSPDASREGSRSQVPMRSGVKFIGEFTLDQAISQLERVFAPELMGFEVVSGSGGIKILTADEYQRSIIETRVYLAPLWVANTESQLLSYASSLQSLLGVKYDLGYTSIQIIGDSIVVAAPPEIHIEVVRFTSELDAILGKRNAERKAEIDKENARVEAARKKRADERDAQLAQAVADRSAEREVAQAEREASKEQFAQEQKELAVELNTQRKHAIERIQAEFNAVRSSFLKTKAKINEVSNAASLIGYISKDNPEKEELESKAQSLRFERKMLEFEHDEIEERYYYLRTRLLESQYEDVFNIPTLTESQQSMILPIIRVKGIGMREGEYQYSSSMRISRMLMSAGALNADSAAIVKLNRRGKTTELGTLHSILSGNMNEFEVFAGDEIIVSAAEK